jgi:hypothetical protein
LPAADILADDGRDRQRKRRQAREVKQAALLAPDEAVEQDVAIWAVSRIEAELTSH